MGTQNNNSESAVSHEDNEKDNKTMRKQDTIRDKIAKEFPLTVEITNFHEEECNEINNTTKTREMEGTLEYYRKLIKEKDKINQITEESPKNNRNILQKSERTNSELIKYLQRKDRKPQMRENTKETDWCEDKFKKEMVLNYTERGKQQEQQKLFILHLLYSTLLQYFITFYLYFTYTLLLQP